MTLGRDDLAGRHWAQSFVLSLGLHGALAAYFLTPLADLLRLPPAPQDIAVSLTVTELSAPLADPDPEPGGSSDDAGLVAEPLQQPEPEALPPVDSLAAAEPLAPASDPSLNPVQPENLPAVSAAASVPPVTDPLPSADQAGGQTTVPDEPQTPSAARAAEQPPAGTTPVPGPLAEFIGRIRGKLAFPCLAVMPEQTPSGDIELRFLAASEGDIRSFAQDLLAGVATPPRQISVLLDPRQCAALNFVRESPLYPVQALNLAIADAGVESGGSLTGAISGAGGRYVSLLVIDDNGVVQDLGNYLTFGSDRVTFDVPMTRFGPERDTGQLLLAIASQGRPAALDTHNGQLAGDFFPALRASVGRSDPLAMLSFTLR